MTNWLTTHYPHPQPDTLPWHIYLQRQHKNAVAGIAIGDRVFFYEYKEQKPIKGGPKSSVGAQGIVRIATVSGPLYERNALIQYADGTTADYGWGVPTSDEATHGFVALADVLRVIGYEGGYLYGFNAGTGVMRLDDEQALTLTKLFDSGADKRVAT